MEINKKPSTSVKDYLYKTLAIKLNIPSDTIEKVIQHSFVNANEKMKSNNSVEIAGFGKFLFNIKKAQKRLETLNQIKQALENKLVNNPEDPKLKYKLETTSEKATTLENRINVQVK